jgi:hypothetical protein
MEHAGINEGKHLVYGAIQRALLAHDDVTLAGTGYGYTDALGHVRELVEKSEWDEAGKHGDQYQRALTCRIVSAIIEQRPARGTGAKPGEPKITREDELPPVLKISDFASRVHNIPFGCGGENAAAALRKMADAIDRGRINIQDVQLVGNAPNDDFTKSTLTLTYFEYLRERDGVFRK